MRWRRVIGWAVAAIAVVVVGWAVFREREPEYKGKTLSEWMMLRDMEVRPMRPIAAPSPAREALRAIGTNGLPWLIKWLRYENPAWKLKLERLVFRLPSWRMQSAAAKLLLRQSTRVSLAAVTIHELGPGATNAIPTLCGILNDRKASEGRYSALHALASLGAPALPCMLDALSSRSYQPSSIVRMIPEIRELGTNASPAVPVLLDCVQRSAGDLKEAAIGALGRLAVEPVTVVPVLIVELTNQDFEIRRTSATALGEFGRNATHAVPTLIQALDDSNPRARAAAKGALRKIAPEELAREEKSGMHPPTVENLFE